jgi:two-component system, chemotaxis family, protein-glutamate methylesterase/glutaminase
MSIRVLVVDDSSLMRRLLSEIIGSVPGFEVVGTAADAAMAREQIKSLCPDVLTLDVQMPGMDGIEFLDRLMRLRPMPVVMVSAFTEAGSETTLKALELGAVDFIAKPRADKGQSFDDYARELTEKLRGAASARLGFRTAPPPFVKPLPARAPLSPVHKPEHVAGKVICLGASTGGTEAIKAFLLGVPADCPPILIVQHMPESFTNSFARRLDQVCPPHVVEAQGGERVEPGNVYVAPGHSHLLVRRSGGVLVTELQQSAPVNRHRPSVDVLFSSAASVVGRQAVGVILTGMGKDGAAGLLKMRQAGANTFGQDEASCVVYGMPREAFLIGAVEEVAGIDEIARRALNAAHGV